MSAFGGKADIHGRYARNRHRYALLDKAETGVALLNAKASLVLFVTRVIDVIEQSDIGALQLNAKLWRPGCQ